MDALTWSDLRSLTSPWAYAVACTPAALDASLASGQADDPRTVAWRISGEACADKRKLMDEFAARLDFPAYFGKNWDALSDCLTDLEWAPASSYTLVLTSAHLLLPGDDQSFRQLVDILRRTSAWWAATDEANPWQDARPLPFHIILQCEPEHLDALVARLGSSGLHIDVRTLHEAGVDAQQA